MTKLNKNVLYIDTSEFGKIKFALSFPFSPLRRGSKRGLGAVKKKTFSIKPQDTHKTLELLDKFLKQSKIKKSEIAKLFVCSGPGTFTGIRVGVSLAQAISMAWGIPVELIEKK